MKVVKIPVQRAYPKSISFGLETYTIKFSRRLKHYGETDPETKTITIRSGLSPRLTLTTFIHELIHVIEFEHPLKISHKMVYELEKAIVELLLDNFL